MVTGLIWKQETTIPVRSLDRNRSEHEKIREQRDGGGPRTSMVSLHAVEDLGRRRRRVAVVSASSVSSAGAERRKGRTKREERVKELGRE